MKVELMLVSSSMGLTVHLNIAEDRLLFTEFLHLHVVLLTNDIQTVHI